jgi:hypothetical protein
LETLRDDEERHREADASEGARPANCRHVYSAGLTAMPARTAAAATRKTPSGFPVARPATIAAMSQPCPTKTPGLIVTPALASAKIGRIA